MDKSCKFAVTFYPKDKTEVAVYSFFNPQFSLSRSNMDMLNIITVLNSTVFTESEAESFLSLGNSFITGLQKLS